MLSFKEQFFQDLANFKVKRKSEIISKLGLNLDLYFYDFEVFPNDWFVTFKNFYNEEIFRFHNDRAGLLNFINDKKNLLLVGFNNSRYDNWILRAVLIGVSPYEVSDWIINQKKKGWEHPALKSFKFFIPEFDCIELNNGGWFGLKNYEVFFGWKVEESQVDFEKTDLTPDEIKKVFDYNLYDVNMTQELFYRLWSVLEAKITLIEMYGLSLVDLSKSKARLGATILKANKFKKPNYDYFYYKTPELIKEFLLTLDNGAEIIEKVEAYQFYTDKAHPKFESFELLLPARDFTFTMMRGGGHGAIESYVSKSSEKILQMDFGAYYMSLLMTFGYGSRTVLNMEQQVKELFDKRQEAKRNKDNSKSEAFKLALVNLYGAMGDPFNPLYDPEKSVSICLTGQLLLYVMQRWLEPYCQVQQVNTDGLDIKISSNENEKKIYQIQEYIMKKTGLILENDFYSYKYQKDVNNYILVKDKADKSTFKLKGSGVRFYNERFHQPDFSKVNFSVNNTLTAIDEAVVNYLVYGIEPLESLKNVKELIRYQYIFEIKGNYTALFYGNQQMPKQKVWRAFFTTSGRPIFKSQLLENGNWKFDKVPRSSEKCSLYLGDIRGLTIEQAPFEIDINYYAKLAWDVINNYLGIDKKTGKQSSIIYSGNDDSCNFCAESLLLQKEIIMFYNKEVCYKCYELKKQV